MEDNVIINFVGDIGLFEKYEERKIDPFSAIYLPNADYNVANFEFITPKEKNINFFDVQLKYSCNYNYFKKLKLEIFDIFSLANNHVNDFGANGVRDVLDIFEKKGIKHFGYSFNEKYNILIIEDNKIKFAFIGCINQGRWSKENNNGSGPDLLDSQKIIELISTLKIECNHVIIYPHWGSELIDIPPPNNVKIARSFIDAGASAVIGTHAHVIQGVENYKNGLIAYGTGSFVYVHQEEVAYDGLVEREYSLCINIKFGTTGIIAYKSYLYKYNNQLLIPEFYEKLPEAQKTYLEFVNNNIENGDLYKKKVKSILLKRELFSFFIRFRKKPFRTLLYYTDYIFKKFIKHLKSS